MSFTPGWIVEYETPSDQPIKKALMTSRNLYYLQSPAAGQKTFLHSYDKFTEKTETIASGHPVADIVSTGRQEIVLLDQFVTVQPLSSQVGEIFQLQPDGTIDTNIRNNSRGYLKAGIGLRATSDYVVTCKWYTLVPPGNSRLLVWRRDGSISDPEMQESALSCQLNQSELPSYRWTVTPFAIFAIDADEVTIVGAQIPTSTDAVMRWSTKLPPLPEKLDAVFCTDDGQLFARSYKGQLFQYVKGAWEWTFGGSSVAHDRDCCAAGGTHFVRSDDKYCYALREDGGWENIGEKITSPRISVDEEGVTTVTGIRNGRQIVSQSLDYLPGKLREEDSATGLVRRSEPATAGLGTWLLTFKTSNSWRAGFSGYVWGYVSDTSSPPNWYRFELPASTYVKGRRYYHRFDLGVDPFHIGQLKLTSSQHYDAFFWDHWTLDYVEAFHVASGNLWHFTVNGDVPDFNDNLNPSYRGDFINWSKYEHVKLETHAEILFWENKPREWGHVALRFKDGTYISWGPVWPVSAGKPSADGKKRTWDGDTKNGTALPLILKLDGLDFDAISKWWKKYDPRSRKYNFLTWNCSTVVWEAFKEGGVLQRDSKILENAGLSNLAHSVTPWQPWHIVAVGQQLYRAGYYEKH